MTFKAQLEKDLHLVFFDPAEFGEQVVMRRVNPPLGSAL